MKSKQVVIRSEAESDIRDAYQWYEAQRKGLGENFLLCIEEALSRALRNPALYSNLQRSSPNTNSSLSVCSLFH